VSYNALLINTCNIETVTKDKWGSPASTVVVTGENCRINYANKIVRDFKGQEVLSLARVFFKSTVALTEASRLYFDGRWHGIQRIERSQNSVAIHHVEVWVD
jgi:hypothetical protein